MKSPTFSYLCGRTHRPMALMAVLPFFLTVDLASAQHITGDLHLIVADSLGEPIPGVNVLVTGSHVQGDRGAASDNLGHCNVLALPPGVVTVRLSHAAYQPIVFKGVVIQLGKTTNLGEIRLRQRTHDMPELPPACREATPAPPRRSPPARSWAIRRLPRWSAPATAG